MATIFEIRTGEQRNVHGYLVIDSLVGGCCYGGLRMAPEISLDSLIQSARTMTLKYAFVGLPFGGAKAGIIADPEMPAVSKKEILKCFGQALKPLLMTRTYIPGSDLGISDDDIRLMLMSNGVKALPRSMISPTTGFYAGLTVFTAAIRAAEHIGLRLEHSTVAVEGFGSVGSSVAEAFWKKGCKVVAISTRHGAIYNPKGLDIDTILTLSKQTGSHVVNRFSDADQIEKETLPTLEVDIFCPCAHPHTITVDNAPRVRARIISPGANAPITAGAYNILVQKGILVLPDFVANCGGILAASMRRSGLSDKFVRHFIEHNFGGKVSNMLHSAQQENMPVSEYAEKITQDKLLKVKQIAEGRSLPNSLLNSAIDLYRKGIIPKMLVTPFASKYFEQIFMS